MSVFRQKIKRKESRHTETEQPFFTPSVSPRIVHFGGAYAGGGTDAARSQSAPHQFDGGGEAVAADGGTSATPIAATPTSAIQTRCSTLTWTDFKGSPPSAKKRGSAAAETFSGFSTKKIGKQTVFDAKFTPSKSWVLPEYAKASDPKKNGCTKPESTCKQFFKHLPKGHTGAWASSSQGCAAAILTSPAPQATNLQECTTVVKADCDTNAPLESARLLSHEQGHWDITCTLVNKANAALATGTALKTINQALQSVWIQAQDDYDNQTNHGCDGGQQSTWDADIAKGLPAISIP